MEEVFFYVMMSFVIIGIIFSIWIVLRYFVCFREGEEVCNSSTEVELIKEAEVEA
jgi:ammonia channel protein AmtB